MIVISNRGSWAKWSSGLVQKLEHGGQDDLVHVDSVDVSGGRGVITLIDVRHIIGRTSDEGLWIDACAGVKWSSLGIKNWLLKGRLSSVAVGRRTVGFLAGTINCSRADTGLQRCPDHWAVRQAASEIRRMGAQWATGDAVVLLLSGSRMSSQGKALVDGSVRLLGMSTAAVLVKGGVEIWINGAMLEAMRSVAWNS